MSVVAFSFYYLFANENYEYYTHNESLISNEHHSFYVFGFLSIPNKNDDLNFFEFNKNDEIISYTSTSDRVKEKSNIKDDLYDNTDEFVVKRIFEFFCELEFPLLMQIIIYKTESKGVKNVSVITKNEESPVLLEFLSLI